MGGRKGSSFFIPRDRFLSRLFAQAVSADPAMHSPAYIKMTSRKGLFGYRGELSTIFFSLHPNDLNTYIIYPPEEISGYQDINYLTDMLGKRNKAIEIIRVPQDSVEEAAKITGASRVLETRLDYRYPVHLIDTQALASLNGAALAKFRGKVKAANRDYITVREIEFSEQDKQVMQGVLNQWASQRFSINAGEHTDYMHFFLDSMFYDDNLKGLISFNHNDPNGFTIWETPLSHYDTANAIIHCSFGGRGVSELLHYHMAKDLANNDIPYLSLGGAEEKGLDNFKRKMNPIRSLYLETLQL